jgi:hypothetical protein
MPITKKQKSWLNQVKISNEERKLKITSMLKISEEDYHDMWLDAGKHYLTDVIAVGEWLDEFMNANIFWKWWFNHWQKWDAKFIAYSKEVPCEHWAKLYDDLHNVEHVDFKPHAVVLEDVFNQEVIKPMTGR